MNRQGVSFILGERLKALREERGLSHVELIKQLNEKYGTTVSRDSLMAYEIADESRAKASKLPNLGMRVEYLYCLADFYGVSIDYLLGKTNVKSADCNMQYMSDYTGLSEKTLQKLNHLEMNTRQPPGDTLYWPNCLANLIEIIFESNAWEHINGYLITAASLMLVEKRFWEKEINGYNELSKQAQYKAKEHWKRGNKSWQNRHFDEDIFSKIVAPDLFAEIPVWSAVASQDYLAEKLLKQLYGMAKEICLTKLEDRINAIEDMEDNGKE